MRTSARLLAFALVLALAFAGASLAGSALDPGGDESGASTRASEHGEAGGHAAARPDHPANPNAGVKTSGLSVTEDGYLLQPAATMLARGRATRFSFRVIGPGGRAVRDFDTDHDREMHLIIVRRDGAVYRHLHPEVDRRGTWSVALDLPEAGTYRAYADFKAGGAKHTLATDLSVPGRFRPQKWPAPGPRARTAGYTVDLDAAPPRAGRPTTLTFAVSRGERPVGGLEPHLGARGHLVTLREGDLGFLHVHPEEVARENEVAFTATFPSAGRYRLFLQFRHRGVVRTVAHTLEVRR